MRVLRVTVFNEAAPQPTTGYPAAIRGLLHRAAGRIRRVRQERWWLLLFTILFLVFFVALLFQPGIGRGGR